MCCDLIFIAQIIATKYQTTNCLSVLITYETFNYVVEEIFSKHIINWRVSYIKNVENSLLEFFFRILFLHLIKYQSVLIRKCCCFLFRSSKGRHTQFKWISNFNRWVATQFDSFRATLLCLFFQPIDVVNVLYAYCRWHFSKKRK